MMTIKRKTRFVPGNYARDCDICGVAWERVDLVRKDNLFVCPDDAAGRELLTLSKEGSRARPETTRGVKR